MEGEGIRATKNSRRGQASSTENLMPWEFILWSMVCLAGSTDTAGRVREACQSWIGAWFGISADSGVAIMRVMALVVRKAPHVVFFGLLGWLATKDRDPRRRRWFLVLGCVVCVVAEALQALTDTRSMRFSDAVLNLVAFGAGASADRFHRRGAEKVSS